MSAKPSLKKTRSDLSLPGFEIEEVFRQDSSGFFCRAQRTSDGRRVIVKVLDPRRCQVRSIEHLKNEYEIGKSVLAPSALMPLVFESLDGMLALIFENFEGEPLDRILRAPMEVGTFLSLSVKIVEAVCDLHKDGLIHKDLKPQSFLVNRANYDVKVIEFGIASRLPREQLKMQPLRFLEGSLPYMSPEQTGRVNRVLDHRSDLYSLGVVFYEMLVGKLPFEGTDPLAWVYSHIARVPPAPSEIVPKTPEMLSRIVTKLLAKVPDDRYQSATGLEWDLEKCLQQWFSTGRISMFPLGERDFSDRFRIPQKIYGRERELAILLSNFDRMAATGVPEFALVSGYSGIGKSSLVYELQKPVLRERGVFLSGKFDQYQRNIPYATFVQAFRELALEILSHSEEEIALWKGRVLKALGNNAKLIVDVIPPMGLILGPQLPVPELSPTEAQNRFRTVFRRFIGVFARKEHPLTLFLDDLQWADSASLSLLQEVMSNPEIRYLFIVGAYRENEVSPSHPLMLALDNLRKEGARISDIVLGPLSVDHIGSLLSDALHHRPEEVMSLAELIHKKTGGNPFFAIQFLSTLRDERLITFDSGSGMWSWNMERIRAKGFTDNVVDLMAEKLKRLPSPTKEALKHLACVGGGADLATFAIIHDRSPEELRKDLWDALSEGLVLQHGDAFVFLHDRVQEAAYSLIPKVARPTEHLRVGRRWITHLSPAELENRVFDVVNQLNWGVGMITDPQEKELLVRLNSLAGRKAKAAIAYASARNYLARAAQLLEEDAWQANYEWTFTLYLDLSECEYLVGNFETADALFNLLIERARTLPERARVYSLRTKLYQVSGRYAEGTTVALDALRLFGVSFPESEKEIQEAFEAEHLEIQKKMKGRRIAELVNAPIVKDPDARAIIRLLADAMPCAYIGRPVIFPLISLKAVNFSLQYGNTEDSCFGYSVYGLILVSLFDDIPAATEFSEMSLRLNEKFADVKWRGTLLHLHGDHIHFWRSPFSSCRPILEESFRACLEVGDFVYASFVAFEGVWQAIEMGDPLVEVLGYSRKFSSFAQQSRNEAVYQTIRLEQQFVASLQGRTLEATCFSDAQFDEAVALKIITDATFGTGVAYYHLMKQIVAYLHGRYDEALKAGASTEARLNAVIALPVEATYRFFHALTLAALFSGASSEEQKRYRELLEKHLEKLAYWAENSPSNYFNRYALVRAELARIEGRDQEAMRFYEESIRSARENGFIQNEGLALELAARFYEARDFRRISEAYLRDARACYLRWGAEGKVRRLEASQPWLAAESREGGAKATFVLSPEQLDLHSIVKASQAISSEIDLNKLISTLLQITLEQSGAQRADLMLVKNGEWFVEATAKFAEKGLQVEFLRSIPMSSFQELPHSIIHYVQRTRKPVLLNDVAAGAGAFVTDVYLAREKPRAVLCLPILLQNRIIGMIYLENRSVSQIFLADRMEVLELLATRAAIALQNARLFNELLQENLQRKEAEEALRASQQQLQSIIDGAAMPIFAKNTEGRYVFINRRFEEIFGLKREMVIGRTDFDLFPKEIAKDYRRNDTQVVGSRVPLEMEEAAPQLDGMHTFITIKVPLFNARGDLYGICGISTDITERKRVEEERKRLLNQEHEARIEAQKSIQLRDDFLAIAAHELRTPLTPLRMYLRLVKRHLEKIPLSLSPSLGPLFNALNSTDREVGRLTVLIENLLDVSRITAGRLILHLEEVDLSKMLQDTMERFSQEFKKAGCRVTLELDPQVKGTWDPSRIEQVLTNLIFNAIKYGAGKPIEVKLVRRGARAEFVVRDYGIGIPKEEQAKLFQRFGRLAPIEHFGGLGMGLFIVRQIVEAHGGTIRVVSEKGKGAVFIVELPAKAEKEAGQVAS